MEEPVGRILRFALCSRVVIIVLQVLSNLLLPDHDPDVFRFQESDNYTTIDRLVKFFDEGLSRWDGQYFLHITKYGYTYENTLVFFPTFPYVVEVISTIFWKVQLLNYESLLLFIGVILNIIFFVISAAFLYCLSRMVLKSKTKSFVAALLFCINPASIFFSAFYSESLFCMLTFMGMQVLEKEHYKTAALLFGLSGCTRSNGILSVGFVLHKKMRVFKQFLLAPPISHWYLFQIMVSTLGQLIMCIIPFLCYQGYAYFAFCTSNFRSKKIPDILINYAAVHNYTLPGKSVEKSPWCNNSIPLSYSYIQKHHWNVGFLAYYELKQWPNFLLASPMLVLVVCSCVKYFANNFKLLCGLGFFKELKYCKHLFKNEKCIAYFVHAFILSVFCIFFIHIQVSTRLLASVSPLPYWVLATLLMDNLTEDERKSVKFQSSDGEKPSVCQDFSKLYQIATFTFIGKLCLFYFLSYFFIGTILFSNFFPWT